MLRPVDPQQSFPELELEVLERWRERDVVALALRHNEDAEPWVFYEGPPTANGPPGSHHVLARVFKDIYPRFRSMAGARVQRKGGWDCHGLPVEIAVERELGITTKAQIEEYGIAEFNARCRAAVFAYLEEWGRLTERIGFWVDLEDAYRTLDASYIESVWWALERIHANGLLYEGHRVVPYCPRCETALSSHEVALGYRDVIGPSVYVTMPIAAAHGPLREGDALLIWTTTPWTLVANAAIAAAPELEYARVRSGEAVYVLASALVERVLGEDAEILERFDGTALEGARYAAPFPFLSAEDFGERAHQVLLGDFVSQEDGTGLVHAAVAFGEDDFRLGQQYGLAVLNPVRANGTYDERIGPYAGRSVRDVDEELIAELSARGRILRAERREHSYPHCWRCGTPLLYYAKPSWYIATSTLRDRLLANNELVQWHPGHIKHGRFGGWLEGNVDWALSRERYWGTPLPIWRCEAGHHVCIGSFAELERRTGVALSDPHRPYVDELSFDCDQCGEQMRRVPEVIDVWFDSGSMPFAQHHAPFENEERFRRAFPADFICEALDQTRGWFYSLHAVATLLWDAPAFRNVVCLGLILDEDGQKMSKSRGNVIDPWEILERYGADAFRWYLFTARAPWDSYRFSIDAVGESTRTFLRQLWNVYGFHVLYFNAAGDAGGASDAARTPLDRWIGSRLAATSEAVRAGLEAYDATSAGRAIAAFVEDLSNWYVRRSRRRFWDGDATAFATLRECLLTLARLLAPFTPFIADEIYDNLDGSEPSVHLCAFPLAGPREPELEYAMGLARETVRLGLAARSQGDVRLRQPLREAVIVASARERDAISSLEEIVREELNVTRLRFVDAAAQLGTYTVKPNFRTLGPRFGSEMPRLAEAIRGLDPEHVAAAFADARPVVVSLAGHDHELGGEDLSLALSAQDGYGLEREGSHAVALELTLDDELIAAGWAREIVHSVQAARRDAGLQISDRVALSLAGDGELLAAARTHERYIAGETLASSVAYAEGGSAPSIKIDGRALQIGLERA